MIAQAHVINQEGKSSECVFDIILNMDNFIVLMHNGILYGVLVRCITFRSQNVQSTSPSAKCRKLNLETDESSESSVSSHQKNRSTKKSENIQVIFYRRLLS